MDAEAYLKLGDIFLNQSDYVNARKYYEKATEGEANGEALWRLGNFYLLGNGVEQDYGKAKEYYEKSAQEDYPKAFAKIGYLYAKGKGVEVDFGKAIEFLEKGISKGDAESMHN